jgi:hypothetical protein
MVPLQVIWGNTTQRRAIGTSLAAILPIALVGALVYYFGAARPQVNLTIAGFLVLGSAAGAFAGAQASRLISERGLKIVVALLLVVVGLKVLRDAVLGTQAALFGHAGGLDLTLYLLIAASGFVIGVLSGLTGVGGGVFIVPVMVVGFGIAQRVAQGTSLVAILPTAAVGALTHYRNGNVDLRSAGWMAAVGAPASVIGAVLALWLPERLLLGLFGLFLLFAAYRTWPWQEEGEAGSVPEKPA